MSFFEDASLVLIPSAQKTSKVYSIKPTDGTGDLAFTRSNDTATRVGPDGLIEKVRTNLILQSETFSNATWGKANTTFSVDTLTANAGTSLKTLNQAQTQQGLQTIYFDVAYVSHSFFQILFGTSATDNQYANFDIQNKVLGTTGGGTISSSIQDFGTYVRIAIVVSTSAKTNVNLAFVDSASALRAASSTSTGSVKVFRSQLETGDVMTDYIATTSAAVSVGPVANVPRLDYLGGGCPKLLLEPQRTNLALFSEQLNNAYWTKNNTTITANTSATLDPTGASGADKIVETATTGFHGIERAFGTLSGSHCLSVLAKAAERNWVYLEFFTGATSFTSFFDLSNGTIGTSAAGNNAKIENYGNGWYRLSISRAAGSGTSFFVAGLATADNTPSYTGDGTSGAYLYGAQIETSAAYATSYIPTLGAAVTRGADAASKTGISSLIGQTEGTLFVEFNSSNVVGVDNIVFGLSTGSALNRIIIFFGTNINAQIRDAGVVQTTITGPASTANTTFKCALAYNLNDVAFYVNGVLVGTDLSATIPATSNVRFDSGAGAGACDVPISQALLFKTRLSNADLAALTA